MGGRTGQAQKKTERDNKSLIKDKIRPLNHTYPVFLIHLALAIKLGTSASFRSISKIVALVSIYLDLNLKSPCHVSILIWMKKVGIYKLAQTNEKGDWVLIIDESVEFGHDKLLVLLGIQEKDIGFDRPLQYEDLSCLKVIASNSWKGEEIKKVMDGLSEEIGKIKYVVADMGNSIKRALKLSGIVHVEDITHKISWIIKELYDEDEQFKAYTKKLAQMRGALALSKVSHLLPPQQRVNSRFMNLVPIFEWGSAGLKSLSSGDISGEEKNQFMFLKDHEDLIAETNQLLGKANTIQGIIKHEGLSSATKKRSLDVFDEKEPLRIERFKLMIDAYMTDMLDKMEGTPKLLCTSDIIESSFGKYKGYISNNISIGITDLALSIPAFIGKLERETVLKGIGHVKVKDIKSWSSENIGQTQLKKRREVLKMGGRKKCPTP